MHRILIVDDDPGIREIVRRILEGDPALTVVGEAADGEEAIERTRALHPDVLLMDIVMPRLNGLEATGRIKAERPGTKVVLISFYPRDVYGPAVGAKGADAYIPKEDLVAALLPTIRALVERSPSSPS